MDKWKHRNSLMKCKTCMWFVMKEVVILEEDGEVAEPILGRCRKHSPTMNGYPAVFIGDWCGDHKLDENKVNIAVLVK